MTCSSFAVFVRAEGKGWKLPTRCLSGRSSSLRIHDFGQRELARLERLPHAGEDEGPTIHLATGHALRRRVVIRSTASSVSPREPNAVRRKYPSPVGPNPEPGMPTTCASARSLSKKSQEESRAGVRTQRYGALLPPWTVSPAPASPLRMIRA